MNKSAKYN